MFPTRAVFHPVGTYFEIAPFDLHVNRERNAVYATDVWEPGGRLVAISLPELPGVRLTEARIGTINLMCGGTVGIDLAQGLFWQLDPHPFIHPGVGLVLAFELHGAVKAIRAEGAGMWIICREERPNVDFLVPR